MSARSAPDAMKRFALAGVGALVGLLLAGSTVFVESQRAHNSQAAAAPVPVYGRGVSFLPVISWEGPSPSRVTRPSTQVQIVWRPPPAATVTPSLAPPTSPKSIAVVCDPSLGGVHRGAVRRLEPLNRAVVKRPVTAGKAIVRGRYNCRCVSAVTGRSQQPRGGTKIGRERRVPYRTRRILFSSQLFRDWWSGLRGSNPSNWLGKPPASQKSLASSGLSKRSDTSGIHRDLPKRTGLYPLS
jgi:hypothetical protein